MWSKIIEYALRFFSGIVDYFNRKEDREAGALKYKDRLSVIVQKEAEDAKDIRANATNLPDSLLLSPKPDSSRRLPSVSTDLHRAGGMGGSEKVENSTPDKSPQPDLAKELPQVKCNRAGIELIKRWETFVSKPYFCAAGKKTIGYGHVILPGESFTSLTEPEAELLLYQDIAKFEKEIGKFIKTILSTNQYSAVVSFVFNIGSAKFAQSTLLKKLNERNYTAASQQFLKWVYATKTDKKGKPVLDKDGKTIKVVLPGLLARRKDEQKLFTS
jgi:lysozyme